jgi:serine/threonine protein kinase
MPLHSGESLGPYRIVKQLGKGGMATVYKAYHPALDRFVAIKILHPAFTLDENFLERFKREARVVARMDHSNIVPIHDFAEHEGSPYLVMKFVAGETLKSRLLRAIVSKDEGLQIIQAVASGLAYAHSHGILHRDVKPSNILISESGEIFLADFGLARIAASGESTLTSDMILGTPQYISPEQARGDKEIDQGTDIYSLGVVLYELVVGQVPFSGDTPYAVIHDHIYAPLPMPCVVNPKVPLSVERVLLKALAKDRSARYATVIEFAGAFESALEHGISADHQAETIQPRKAKSVASLEIANHSSVTSRPAQKVEVMVTQDLEDEAIEQSGTNRGKRTWIWIVGGFAVMCLTAFLLLHNIDFGSLPFRTDGPSELGPSEQTGGNDFSEQITAARNVAAENPGDPFARLLLAEVLRADQQIRPAVGAYVAAAELFLDQGLPEEAAQAIIAVMEIEGGLLGQPARVIELAGEAFYLGVASDEILGFLETVRRREPQWDSLSALIARGYLLRDDPAQAEFELQMGPSIDVPSPIALAVQADVKAALGADQEALEIIDQVRNHPKTQDWLFEQLEIMTKEILSE